MKTVVIRCFGRVQGVFFRKYTQLKAQQLFLVGFVRNEPDGSVFILVKGNDDELAEFEAWCQIGSPLAKVDKVISESGEDRALNEKLEGFEIRQS